MSNWPDATRDLQLAAMTDVTWLTQEAHDRLVGELAEREGPTRVEITKRIEAAREEGDLKENGGYHAAKEEQGKNEARIRQLTATPGIGADRGSRRGRRRGRCRQGSHDQVRGIR